MAFIWNPFTGTLDATSSGGGGLSNSFVTIQTDTGTSPVATSNSDTLTLTSTQTIAVSGNSTTDTITFDIANPLGFPDDTINDSTQPDSFTVHGINKTMGTADGGNLILVGGTSADIGNHIPGTVQIQQINFVDETNPGQFQGIFAINNDDNDDVSANGLYLSAAGKTNGTGVGGIVQLVGGGSVGGVSGDAYLSAGYNPDDSLTGNAWLQGQKIVLECVTTNPIVSVDVGRVDDASADDVKPADITFHGANKNDGTGDGGDIVIKGGTSAGGIVGNVRFNGIPTSASGLPSGAIWVDTGSGNVLKMVP